MKLLSYRRDGVESIGVLVGARVLDLGEASTKYYDGSFTDLYEKRLTDMLSFLNLEEYGLREAQKAHDWAAEKDDAGSGDMVLVRLNDVELMAPIPYPKKNVV
jgi:hypothetical protein